MLKIEKVQVFNISGAMRGMRNPLNSWHKSDTAGDKIGSNDLDLAKRLYNAGTEHRKYARQIFVSMDIVAPLYWWKEFDTYKIGTMSNSCSTMHKITDKEFTLDDFSHEHMEKRTLDMMINHIIPTLNIYRKLYIQSSSQTGNKSNWWQIIQLLPSSYNQKRTITMTYENVFNIIKQRTGHKLDEWRSLVSALDELPYIKEITE